MSGSQSGRRRTFDFAERLGELNEELELLNAEAHQLEERIGENVAMILEEDGMTDSWTRNRL